MSLSSCDAWWMGPTGKGRKGCVNLIVLAEGAILGKYYINFIIIGLNEPRVGPLVHQTKRIWFSLLANA